ncbi:response regulator [Tropicibacter naphthalenivorans]|uniref:Chemotaxis-specific methylesterase n=1 Tax=Tropicibacter naphthalenivorans TaxID=441103 RepID=A0A0P1G6M5_9RHOB|nr:response regulator [Tropicibacter naphthalenivorans]CUH77391.1 chemotaxis-specific methylesterase [Tropicibacter naphthalenivorans]SMC58319.1 Response regulator receiver domain-containing protein [Tropicibacter naphthalenivorans]
MRSAKKMDNETKEFVVALNSGRESRKPLNILFLDDQEVDRLRLRKFSEKAGLKFKTFEASNLAEFRAALDSKPMDLVFLDYFLDMETGLDALKILIAHEDQSEALPIMVTSVERHDIAVEAMRNGCADYITKEELSVSTVRKSILSAFERRVLIAAVGQSHSSRAEIQRSARKIAETCGPEMRTTLAGTLRHIRGLRQAHSLAPSTNQNLTALEKSCHEIYGFLDDISETLNKRAAQAERPSASTNS